MRILVDGGALSASAGDTAGEFWGSFLPALAQRLRRCEICLLNRGSAAPLPDRAGLRNFFAPPVDFEVSAQEDRRLRRLCRLLDAAVFLSTCHTSAGIDTPSLFVCFAPPPRNRGPLASSRRAARMAARHFAVGDREAAWAADAHGLPLSLFRVPDPRTPLTLAEAAAEAVEALGARTLVVDELHAVRRATEEQATAALAARLKRIGERRAVWRYRRARWARVAGQPRRFLEYLRRRMN